MGIRFTEDPGGVCFTVDDEDGPLFTSDAYIDEQAAREGWERMKRAIAATAFTPDWPGGVQKLSMPFALGEDNSITAISRVESGPVRFGDDWTGLFLRGDSCFAYAMALKAEREGKSNAFARAGVDGLITALQSTNERGT